MPSCSKYKLPLFAKPSFDFQLIVLLQNGDLDQRDLEFQVNILPPKLLVRENYSCYERLCTVMCMGYVVDNCSR